MTLLQLLARELKEWPKSVLKPEDDKCCMSDEDSTVYFGHGRPSFTASRRANSTRGVYVGRPQWQAARAEYLESVKAMPWPDGATHYVPAQTPMENDVFYKVEGGVAAVSWALEGGMVYGPYVLPKRNMRHTLPGAVERSWLWPSLPPIGAKAVAEFRSADRLSSMRVWKDGDELECVAHYAPHKGGEIYPLFVNERVCTFSIMTSDCYRLVDEHASEAIKRICSDLDVTHEVARRILDKGYRKQVDA